MIDFARSSGTGPVRLPLLARWFGVRPTVPIYPVRLERFRLLNPLLEPEDDSHVRTVKG